MPGGASELSCLRTGQHCMPANKPRRQEEVGCPAGRDAGCGPTSHSVPYLSDVPTVPALPALPHPLPRCSMAVHMDCLHWVNRDSYLPQGSRGLKVAKARVGCLPGGK
jgi:hypothetical protein